MKIGIVSFQAYDVNNTDKWRNKVLETRDQEETALVQ